MQAGERFVFSWRAGVNFFLSLVLSIGFTAGGYFIMIALLRRLGIGV